MKNMIGFVSAAFALAVVPGSLSQAQTTSGKQNAAINITECGTIPQAGSYVLANNLTASGGYCLTVAADSVTIDLAGFQITGPGDGAGIFGATNNVVVRNGTVTGFTDGIFLGSASQGSIVDGVRAINNQTGIQLLGSGHVVRGSTAEDNRSTGIWTGENALVSDNTVRQNGGDGIRAGAGNIVRDNRVQSNGEAGIVIWPGDGGVPGSGVLVSGNVVRMNGKTGISTGPGSTVSGNIAQRNGPRASPTGIEVGPGSTVSNNTAEGNQIFAACNGSWGISLP